MTFLPRLLPLALLLLAIAGPARAGEDHAGEDHAGPPWLAAHGGGAVRLVIGPGSGWREDVGLAPRAGRAGRVPRLRDLLFVTAGVDGRHRVGIGGRYDAQRRELRAIIALRLDF